jgi:WD40 repeat protein
VYAWDPDSHVLVARLATRSVTTFGITVSADGHTLVGGDSLGQITVWQLGQTVMGDRHGSAIAVALHPDDKLMATVDGAGFLELWDSTTGDLLKRVKAHEGAAYDVDFAPDGKELATSGEDGAVIVWRVSDVVEQRRFSRPGTVMASMRYSPDGKQIAVAGRSPATSTEDRDEILLLRSADLSLSPQRRSTRGEPRNGESKTLETNYPTGIAFSPDGKTLAVPLSAGKVGLWNLVDPGAELTILPGHDGIAIDADFSPDGAVLATGGSDRIVKLWRVRDGQQVGELTGSDSTIRRVAFSPDGKSLATASQDTVVRLWNVEDRRFLARLDRHEDQLNDLEFDSGGKRLVSVGADGVARVFYLDPAHGTEVLCGLLDRETLADEWNALGPDRGKAPTCPE